MCEVPLPEQSEGISHEHVTTAGSEHHRVCVADPVQKGRRPARHLAHPQPALEWRGPMSFARTYGVVPGIHHDFGIRCGPNGDQPVSLRVEPGADSGLLYVYDLTWDEYAVLGSEVPVAAVESAGAHAWLLEDLPVEDFVTMVQDQPAAPPPAQPRA